MIVNAPLLEAHREHLRASGLTDATIEAAGIYSVTDAIEATELLNWKGSDGPVPSIAFPNTLQDGKVAFTLLRPDVPRQRKDGRQPKYESPVNTAPRLYFPPEPLVGGAWTDATQPLVITEGIKKALAVVQAGYVAISAQGTTVLHDIEHRKQTKEHRLHPDFESLPLHKREVYIAFDGGDTTSHTSVIHAEARLAQMLMAAGASVRLIRVPHGGQNAPKVGIDDFLVQQADPTAALSRLLASAKPANPRLRAKEAKSADDPGDAAAALLDDLSFCASLLLADRAGVEMTAKLLPVSMKALEERVEQFRKLMRPPDSGPAKQQPPDPSIVKVAETLINSPFLLELFLDELADCGLVGERGAASIITLAACTRMWPSPVNLVVRAASAVGKSFLANMVLRFFPPDALVEISNLSPKALFHMADGGLSEKIVLITEQDGAEGAEYALRLAMSEGKITSLVAEAGDAVDGEPGIRSRHSTVMVQASFITTTTRSRFHDENETRVLEVNLDESAVQTERILDAQAAQAAGLGLSDMTGAIEEWRLVFDRLQPLEVVVPQAKAVKDSIPMCRLRARRDFPKLLSLIRAHAFLHQRTRERLNGKVVAADTDVAVARALCAPLFSSITPRMARTAEKLRAKLNDSEFTNKDAAKELGSETTATGRLLKTMLPEELVELTVEGKGNQPHLWRMVAVDS